MSKSLNATKNRTTGNKSKSNFIAPLYRRGPERSRLPAAPQAADLSRNRPGPSYTSASVPPGITCLRRHKGEEYGRTPYRAEIPVRGRTRSRRLLVVPLRGLEKPAVLRRHAQRQRVRAGEIRGGQGRKALAVRLQAYPQPAFLPRQPQDALGGRRT